MIIENAEEENANIHSNKLAYVTNATIKKVNASLNQIDSSFNI